MQKSEGEDREDHRRRYNELCSELGKLGGAIYIQNAKMFPTQPNAEERLDTLQRELGKQVQLLVALHQHQLDQVSPSRELKAA